MSGSGVLTFVPSAGQDVAISDSITDAESVGGVGRSSLAKAYRKH